MATPRLIATIRADLRAAADPDRAPTMQAYMKSQMPYLGVGVPIVRKLVKAAARHDPITSIDELASIAGALWREATYREERYAATELTALRIARGELSLLPLYEEFIVTGAWWDHVDEVAHRVGDLLQAHREVMGPTLRQWAVGQDHWLRRVAIIGQLGAKADLDRDLLTFAIEANQGESDFFLRKAIGWALRDYAWSHPDWVRAFVAAHPDLSGLSRREALKHL